MSTQNEYAVMEWPTDNGKLSIHQLKLIKEPIKKWNDFQVGDEGLAFYPGFKELWKFKILAVGATRKALEKKLHELLLQKAEGPNEDLEKEKKNKHQEKEKKKEQPQKEKSKNDKRKKIENEKLPVKKRKGKIAKDLFSPLSSDESETEEQQLNQTVQKDALKSAVTTLLSSRPDNVAKKIETQVMQNDQGYNGNISFTSQNGNNFTSQNGNNSTPQNGINSTPQNGNNFAPQNGNNFAPQNGNNFTPQSLNNSFSFQTFGGNQTLPHSFNNHIDNWCSNDFSINGENYYTNESGRNFNLMPPNNSNNLQTFDMNNAMQTRNQSMQDGNDNCHDCCTMLCELKEDYDKLQEDHTKLQDDFDKLKHDVEKMKKILKKSPSAAASFTSPVPVSESDNTNPSLLDMELYNGHTKDHIETRISQACNLTEAVKISLKLAFTQQELLSCSVTGQKQNSNAGTCKPGLDETRRQFLEDALGKRYGVPIKDIRGKMRDRLKLYRKAYLGVE